MAVFRYATKTKAKLQAKLNESGLKVTVRCKSRQPMFAFNSVGALDANENGLRNSQKIAFVFQQIPYTNSFRTRRLTNQIQNNNRNKTPVKLQSNIKNLTSK